MPPIVPTRGPVALPATPQPLSARFKRDLQGYLSQVDPRALHPVPLSSLPPAAQAALRQTYPRLDRMDAQFFDLDVQGSAGERHQVFAAHLNRSAGFEGRRLLTTESWHVFGAAGGRIMYGQRTPDPGLLLSNRFSWR
jgi:hypothetical protein